MSLDGYYNEFNESDDYEKLLFRAGKGLQSRELNEIQDQAFSQTKNIADVIFNDGDIMAGSDCIINIDTGLTQLTSGQIYIKGMVRSVPEELITIPLDTSLHIGVLLTETWVTELEDPSLREPAKGTRNYHEAGAGRLKIVAKWTLFDAQSEGDFYPVHEVINAVVKVKVPPPQLDAVTTALARYDREANGGSYIVKGLSLSFIENDLSAKEQVFSLSEGKSHVNGYEVELSHATRIRYPFSKDLMRVDSEPHRFAPDSDGNMRIDLNHAPISEVFATDVTQEKTVTITHGSYSGAKDPLPDSAVLEFISIRQGDTEYVIGDDVKLTGSQVDWSLSGDEPSPGSSYVVVYHHRTRATITDEDQYGFVVSGIVVGSLVLVDYDWAMPRTDLLVIDKESNVRKIKGISHPWYPPTPQAPLDQLTIATIYHTWLEAPVVVNNGIRVVSMDAIENMRSSIYDLYDLVAIERLKTNALTSNPAAKRGVFVDPMNNNNLRDQGIAQTGAIVNGALQLPIEVDVMQIELRDALSLAYDLEVVLDQNFQTGEMKVNPYQAFAPLPARITLNPAVDRWTEPQTQWLDPITRRINRGGGWLRAVSTSSIDQIISTSTQQVDNLRQIDIAFSLEGFGNSEELSNVIFDGITVEVRA